MPAGTHMVGATSRPIETSFDDAAEFYDHQPNPMLALEERFLSGLLPSLRGLDVLDIGCGTGRWLHRLQDSPAASLTGVDPSSGMLSVARRKLKAGVSLLQGTASSLPLPDRSADVILLSFTLSYCEQIANVARELARVARPGASIFISDLHAKTEMHLDWKRSFQSRCGVTAMRTVSHDFRATMDIFRNFGFRAACVLELPFGPEEEVLFTRSGKQFAFEAARDLPAIYVAQFTTSAHVSTSAGVLKNARVAFGASAAAPASISIGAGRITSILSTPRLADDAQQELDLKGCMVLPGLLNAHDHLDFGLYPNLGRGPYESCCRWAEDVQANHRPLIERHTQIPKDVRLYWGALRNLLAGVTSVCHHNPQSSVFRNPDFPLRVVDELSWSHSLSFDPGVQQTFERSSPTHPFVIHAAEGINRAASREIAELDRMGVLTDRTVLIHGISASTGDIDLINERGAALVCCPSSNLFLFGRTLDPGPLQRLRFTALGTDSPLTAAGDLLAELRIASEVWRLSASELYAMCTSRAASILRLRNGEGAVRIGSYADVLVVRDTGATPADRLLKLCLEDIELVLIGGRVHLASDEKMRSLPEELRIGLFPMRVDNVLRWVRAPLPFLFAEAEAVLGRELLLGKKRVTYAG